MTTKKEAKHKPEKSDSVKAAPNVKVKTKEKPTKKTNAESVRELQATLAEYEGLIKRQQSEFENFRKRTLKEKEETLKYGASKIFERLLPVLDDFERALSAENPNQPQAADLKKAYLEGFDMIYKQLQTFLQDHGVEPLGEVGDVFDPAKHQSIQFEEGNGADDTISEVYQKGYLLGERVLRAATVKVRKKSTSADLSAKAEQEQD